MEDKCLCDVRMREARDKGKIVAYVLNFLAVVLDKRGKAFYSDLDASNGILREEYGSKPAAAKFAHEFILVNATKLAALIGLHGLRITYRVIDHFNSHGASTNTL